MPIQPKMPKKRVPEPTTPVEEVNLIVVETDDHLTPEQKTWPVMKADKTMTQPKPAPANQPPSAS